MGLLVGMTYDLRTDYLKEGFTEDETAEFDRESTIEAIESALNKLGYKTERVGHVRNLVAQLAAGKRWDLVFNITEGMYGMSRESQVPALLEAYRIPYTFSDAITLGISLDKAITKIILRDAGVPTPDFAVVRSPTDLEKIKLPYPLFAKPIAEGTGKGITKDSKVTSFEALKKVCLDLLKRYNQPVLVETYLPGREVTTGVWGTGDQAEAIGTMEIHVRDNAETKDYTYTNKEYCENWVDYSTATGPFAEEAARVAVAAWRAMGCRDAGRIDLRAGPDGHLQVMELNPLAGLHPEHSDLPMICTRMGIPFVDLIDRIMRSAVARAGLEIPKRVG